MPKVLNKRGMAKLPEGAVYVGRPSKWGNPFVIGRDGSRRVVMRKYAQWVSARMKDYKDDFGKEMVRELKGKDLICWCAPEACHADILLHLANGGELNDDFEAE